MPVDLNKTIVQISQLLQRSLDKKIDIVHDFSVANTFTIGDPAQLENALLNIAINAGHAMPEGGTLTFSTSIVVAVNRPCPSFNVLRYINSI